MIELVKRGFMSECPGTDAPSLRRLWRSSLDQVAPNAVAVDGEPCTTLEADDPGESSD